MAQEFDRKAHARFTADIAHLFEAGKGRFADSLTRDFLESDCRHRDDGLAANFLTPFTHLTQFAQCFFIICLRQIIEVLKRIEGPWFDRCAAK